MYGNLKSMDDNRQTSYATCKLGNYHSEKQIYEIKYTK